MMVIEKFIYGYSSIKKCAYSLQYWNDGKEGSFPSLKMPDILVTLSSTAKL